jgi:hypothetical protein
VTERVEVILSSITRDCETAFRARGHGFQGLAVVAPTRPEVEREVEEVLSALRRARGLHGPFQIVWRQP